MVRLRTEGVSTVPPLSPRSLSRLPFGNLLPAMETSLPPILETKLADFRRRVWVVKLAEGALGAVFGIALSYLVVFVLDRFMETPAGLRWAILLTRATIIGFAVS